METREIAAHAFDRHTRLHLGGDAMGGLTYAHIHDAYHPLPDQLGEGRPGSGLLMSWTESEATLARTAAEVRPAEG